MNAALMLRVSPKVAEINPKPLGHIGQQPSTWRGRSEQILLNQVGCEARKIPANGGVFFLDFYLYRTSLVSPTADPCGGRQETGVPTATPASPNRRWETLGACNGTARLKTPRN